ncbi:MULTISPECIES: riboflavin synthase subunit alpha [Thalassotalea]|uniref:Riboflavin synthase n=1 Tax=Thalassotalea castellviae TaxID=3075612 RepID=A0ABU3A6L9_9GAMM|nr:riboflavin synthase subunit alpha [Thalassotalea sp. W431]MDT0605192.1 riboflavin synthase subunit alpha [Thalassotalea sp. W431]
MFTGIVQSQAEVYSAKYVNNFLHLIIKVQREFVDNLTLGASIAINGVCLTVVKFEITNNQAFISFDVIDETLARSNLAKLHTGMFVNVERSLSVGDEIGGHMVSGHVHTKATLVENKVTDKNCCMSFEIDTKWHKYILPKGFITVNGISLTVGELTNGQFTVHLIPETLSRTNLASLALLDEVNIEFDQQTMTIVTTIERMKLSENFAYDATSTI